MQAETFFSKGDVVLVGVSGGADSMAMLLLLLDLRHILGINLIVAHYDHAFRASSARDALFVKKIAERLGLPCVIKERTGRSPKGSLEEYARKMRYAFFLDTARKTKADALALAHTQDDLAETVFMRILRGTGVDGLRAILPQRNINGLNVVRPILALTRKDVESFLNSRKQRFLTDPTNMSDDFLRNVIRRKIFPFIQKEGGQDIKPSLVRLAETATVDYDLIEKSAEGVCQGRTLKGEFGGIKTTGWELLHLSTRRALIRSMALKAKNDFKPPSLSHVDKIDRMIMAGRSFVYGLPGKMTVVFKQEKLLFYKN